MSSSSNLIFQNLKILYNKTPRFSQSAENGWIHYAIFIVFLFIILFLNIKIEVAYDARNWNIMKCNPKYIFMSGLLKNDGDLGNLEETIKNYKECTSQSARKVIQSLNSELILDEDNKKTFMMKNRDILNAVKEINLETNETDKSNVYSADDVSVNLGITSDSAAYYSYLKKLGIYVDQMDAVFNYINEYIKGYLSYLFIHYQKNNNETAQKQVKYLLDTHYGGINI
jgi:hypothetical protein